MGSSQSSVKESVPEDLECLPPLWEAPATESSANTTQFPLVKYDKEYIATTLGATFGGSSLSVDTSKRKLVLQSGDKVLGVAKRCGRAFHVFRMEPNYPGQRATDKLQRAGNAPLYFHTQVRRQGKETTVFQLQNKQMYQIRSGPRMSLEKYCTDPETGEDCAMWKYRGKRNHVEIFGQDMDVGLFILLVIIADCFDVDAVLDKAMVAAIVG
ncbi:expressed unknown protein [Seminavis robusta]|uniref:Uncharacterized protein n=1 Tax=Seminavis robusta TaxID=568900 RepID=A0A9N8E4N9_9STRA|nr:expressed unknown protein [Seminavis robusta]|eukprot:Sro616_g176010.1 n/a (212) ;mRNA; f:39289-39924